MWKDVLRGAGRGEATNPGFESHKGRKKKAQGGVWVEKKKLKGECEKKKLKGECN
jgi:hypothetical protein